MHPDVFFHMSHWTNRVTQKIGQNMVELHCNDHVLWWLIFCNGRLCKIVVPQWPSIKPILFHKKAGKFTINLAYFTISLPILFKFLAAFSNHQIFRRSLPAVIFSSFTQNPRPKMAPKVPWLDSPRLSMGRPWLLPKGAGGLFLGGTRDQKSLHP